MTWEGTTPEVFWWRRCWIIDKNIKPKSQPKLLEIPTSQLATPPLADLKELFHVRLERKPHVSDPFIRGTVFSGSFWRQQSRVAPHWGMSRARNQTFRRTSTLTLKINKRPRVCDDFNAMSACRWCINNFVWSEKKIVWQKSPHPYLISQLTG